MADTCRGCGASILWAVTPAGKKMPLDEKAITVCEVVGDEIVRQVRGHVSHFATCPKASTFRRKDNQQEHI